MEEGANCVVSIAERDDRFHELRDVFAFFRFPRNDEALQFDFGNRATPHATTTGGIASEKGPTLSYTLAPTGEVITLIFPAKSDVHRVKEDCIALRMSHRTAHQLLKALPQDIRDLVTYCLVTSIGCDATWRERLRIRWLGWTRGISVGGAGVQQPAVAALTGELAQSAAKNAAKHFVIVAAAASVPLVIAALVFSGFPELGLKFGTWLTSHATHP